MGAISSEIVQLLITEGKIVIIKWPEMAPPAFLVFKIFRGRTLEPPFHIS